MDKTRFAYQQKLGIRNKSIELKTWYIPCPFLHKHNIDVYIYTHLRRV